VVPPGPLITNLRHLSCFYAVQLVKLGQGLLHPRDRQRLAVTRQGGMPLSKHERQQKILSNLVDGLARENGVRGLRTRDRLARETQTC